MQANFTNFFAGCFLLNFCRLMVVGAWITTLVLASPQAIIFRSNHYLQPTHSRDSNYFQSYHINDMIQGTETPRPRFLPGKDFVYQTQGSPVRIRRKAAKVSLKLSLDRAFFGGRQPLGQDLLTHTN